jgi:starch synthase
MHMDQEYPLDIVMFSAEAVPYVKVGGLADVVGALPRALEREGARVRVILPAYKAIQHFEHGIDPYSPLPRFDQVFGTRTLQVEVFRTTLPGSRVDVFFVGNGQYFYRDGIYDDPFTREGYRDNMERFVFFMKAGLELLLRLGKPVDVIHCHDSQTGLIPGLLRTSHASHPLFARAGALFTIHNLAYQSVYPKETLQLAGVEEKRHFFPGSPYEFWGKVNFMKVGIECADLVNTVSETYALEIQSSFEYGHGLEGVLRRKKYDLTGIVNGIDYDVWNPETDPLLPAHFSSPGEPGKAICKAAVLKAFGLPRSERRVPLVGMVSRLAAQKGFDLIEQAGEQIMSMDLQMVVLGTGQQKYHDLLHDMEMRYPGKFAFRAGFNNALAHSIFAGSDILLMPSHYEPCGLNQLYSLRYGTVPVVRATGGLVDTVTDYDPANDRGTGFRFNNGTASDLLAAVERSLQVYADQERWTRLARNGMAQNWSWTESARKYMFLYRNTHLRRHPNP